MAIQAPQQQQQQQQQQQFYDNASLPWPCLPFAKMGSVVNGVGDASLMMNAYLQQQQQMGMMMGGSPIIGVGQNGRVPTGVPLAALLIEKQRREEDKFILQQAENFRLNLQQLRKRHAASMMKLLESKASVLLRKKDEEMTEVMKRNTELQEFIQKGEIEINTWQKIAKENEAMALELTQRLQQIQKNSIHHNVVIDGNIFATEELLDCSSTSSSPLPQRQEGDKKQEDVEVEMLPGRCRWCNSCDACVLFLPCTHLSACKACAGSLTTCPICSTVKQGSFEVFMS